jgi:hypothetical protein
MSLLVRDVTNLDENVAFRNDVQIDEYRGKTNTELVKSFMFTAGDIEGKHSTSRLLEIFCQAITDKQDNRFIVRATFGQGKSHFALMLTNFFGRAGDSPPVKEIFQKLIPAISAPRVLTLRDFKKFKKPFLTILLRGDTPGGLREKFFRALEASLIDHTSTKNIQTPFWFVKAQKYFSELSKSDIDRANAFLKTHKTDIKLLLADLENRRSQCYQVCIELGTHLLKVKPDFGGETSIADALKWVVDTLVADDDNPDKPLGGVLVLFDEFGVFVKDYNSVNPTGVPLQELLNGVSNYPGKALCVAFAQYDPERMVGSGSDTASEALRKELNRFPKNCRFTQHSSLEDVLAGYFRPNKENWEKLMKTRGVADVFGSASDIAHELFAVRYQSIGWRSEQFQERVAKVCFPLHPLVITLLASLDFEGAASSTRNVLGFLKDKDKPVVQSLEQPAIVDGLPNFVQPVALVDYFKESLSPTIWQQYQSVRIPDMTGEQQLVLKAMYLQIAGDLQSKAVGGYAKLIAALSGLPLEEADKTLRLLEIGSYVKFDPANKVYSFYQGGNQSIELERKVAAKLEELRKNDRIKHLLEELDPAGTTWYIEKFENKDSKFFQHYDVTVGWGHPQDWQAQELILTRRGFSSQNLDKLLRNRLVMNLGEQRHKARGLVILLVAQSDDDVVWFREQTQKILDTSESVKEAPVLVLRPEESASNLVDRLLRYAVLAREFATVAQIRAIGGQEIYDERKEQDERQLLSLFKNLREQAVITVPSGFRKAIEALPPSRDIDNRIGTRLTEMYRLAYHKSPRDFYSTYQIGQINLKNAVSTLIPFLIENNLKNFIPPAGGPGKVAAEIISKYLEPKWGVVRQKTLRDPNPEVGVFAVWDRLDKAITPDDESVQLKGILTEFLNRPYGYDVNTLTLVFCAWFGKYNTELIFASKGKQSTLTEAIGSDRSPQKFLELLESATLKRRDKSADRKSLDDLLLRLKNDDIFTLEECQESLVILSQATGDFDKVFKDTIKAAHGKLHTAKRAFEQYRDLVIQANTRLEQATRLKDLKEVVELVEDLRYPTLIKTDLPKPEELKQRLQEKMLEIATQISQRYETLSSLEDYSRNKDELEGLKKQLDTFHLNTKRVDQALQTLEKSRAGLKTQGESKDLLDKIATIKVVETRGLAELRHDLGELRMLLAINELVGSKRQEKLTALEQTIEGLVEKLNTLIGKLESVEDAPTARKLQLELSKIENLFVNTVEFSQIAYANEQTTHLEKFFQEINLGTPNNPNHLQELQARLEATRAQYYDKISPTVLELVEQRQTELQGFADKKTQEAEKWLAERLQRATTSKPEQLKVLLGELNILPNFLPEPSRVNAQELRAGLQQKLETAAQEDGILREIEQVKTFGSFEVLQLAAERLEQFVAATPKIAERLEAKKALVAQELDKLEQETAKLLTELNQLVTVKAVAELRDKISKMQGRIGQSRYEPLLLAEQNKASRVLEILQEVERIPMPANLEQHIAHQARLQELQQSLSAVQQIKLQERLTAIETHVQKQSETAKHWLDDLSQRIVQETDTDKIRSYKIKLETPPPFFPTTQEQSRLDTLHLAAEIESYLLEVQLLKKSGLLKSPADFGERIEQIQALQAQHNHLSAQQKSLAEKLLNETKDAAQKKYEEARHWLAQQQIALDTGKDLERIEQELTKPHDFLTASDQENLGTLKAKVRSKLDEDEVKAITQRFGKITDRQKRLACLAELQRLLESEAL